VHRLVAEGARVVAVGRDEDRLGEVRRTSADPDRVETLVADLAEAGTGRVVAAEAVARLGRLDVLVNNAGIAVDGGALDTSDDAWRLTLAVNLDAAFEASQVAAGHMAESGGGSIVNVASIDGLQAESGLLAYNVSKAALLMLTKTFALELGHRGVRVNAVAPGMTVSAMTRDDIEDAAFSRHYLTMIPMQRWARADEQAAAIAFLASDDASYVNGATLVVDGGQTTGSWYYPQDVPSLPEG
jgi:meso-butanediol dehydrogenase/(S,S)-butanediol dehydrogenase/diacetyl reductase